MGKEARAGEARCGARGGGELITVEEITERAKRLPPPVDGCDQMALISIASSLRAINGVRDELADERRRCIEEVRNKRENVASRLIEALRPRFLGITCGLGVGVWPGDEGKADRRPIEEEDRKAAEEFESSPAALELKQQEKKYLRDALSSIKDLEKWTRGRKRGDEWLRLRQILMPLEEVRMPGIGTLGNIAVSDLTRKG